MKRGDAGDGLQSGPAAAAWALPEETALGELGDTMAVGQEPVVADAMESVWKSMQQEARNYPPFAPVSNL